MFLKPTIIISLIFFCSQFGVAQEEGKFSMDVSSDTVLMGNTFTLSYNIENMNGEFIAPDLSDFRIVHGPNVSSQYSSINGRVSQRSSYTYYLLPKEEGVGEIGAARIEWEGDWVELDPVKIIILENPHEIEGSYGAPLTKSHKGAKKDSLSESQRLLLEKLKKGKRKKI